MAYIQLGNVSVFRSLRPNWKTAGGSSSEMGMPLLTATEIEACSSLGGPLSRGPYSAFEVEREGRRANNVLRDPS